MLKAEPIIENGWIEQFSKYAKDKRQIKSLFAIEREEYLKQENNEDILSNNIVVYSFIM